MSEDRVLLAFETSSALGSVAVARGGDVLAVGWLEDMGRHGMHLVPEIAASLRRADLSREAIGGVVVGHGPGSFTGLRVAVATAKGLARSLEVPLWHHSSLAAAAVSEGAYLPDSVRSRWGELHDPSGEMGDVPRYVLFDARSDRVYAACYRVVGDRIVCLVEPAATTIARVLAEPIPDDAEFLGQGALEHSRAIAEAGYVVRPLPDGIPTAEGLLCAHRLLSWVEPVPQTPWEPEYLRGSTAAAPSYLDRRRG